MLGDVNRAGVIRAKTLEILIKVVLILKLLPLLVLTTSYEVLIFIYIFNSFNNFWFMAERYGSSGKKIKLLIKLWLIYYIKEELKPLHGYK